MSCFAISQSSVKRILIIIVRLIIGGTFFISGLLKVVYPDEFRKTLSTHGLFSAETIQLISLLLPWAEVAIGLLFAFGYKVKVVGKIIICLLILFTIEGSFALALGSVVDCGCFPSEGGAEPMGIKFFLRNGLLILSCLWVMAEHGKPSHDSEKAVQVV